MFLTNDAKEILSNAFEEFNRTKCRTFTISFDDDLDDDFKPEDISKIYNALDLLEEYSLIECEACASGFVQFRITTDGLAYFSNSTKSVSPIPFIQGNNNIIVHGSGNSVSGCYNTIHSKIQSSELSDDAKQCINILLSKMQDDSLSADKKESAIRSFLRDITSGTLSNSASTALVSLLSLLFQNLPF